MLALLNRANAMRCHMQDQWWQVPWCLTLLTEVMIGEQRRHGGRGRTREGEEGSNRGG